MIGTIDTIPCPPCCRCGTRHMREDGFPMAAKRSKKGKKRQKTLQRWYQRAARTRRSMTHIPPESADQVAMTTTGELMQPIRLHYEVEDFDTLRAALASVRCIDYDA